MVCDGPLEPAVVPDGTTLRVIDDAAGVADLVAICDAAYQSLGMPAGVIADMVTAPDRVLVPHVKTVVAADGDHPGGLRPAPARQRGRPACTTSAP